MNKLGLIILLGISQFSVPIFSQEKPKSNWYFFGSIGYQKPEVADLNKVLIDNDFPTLSDSWISMDLSITYKIKKHNIICEISGSSSWDSKTNNQNNESRLSSRAVNVIYGYDIFSNQKVNIFPFIGITANSGSLELSNSRIESNDFRATLLSFNDQNSYDISMTSFIYGIQSNFTIHKRLLIGMKFGYSCPFLYETFWRLNDNELTNVVDVNPGGLYSRVSIGFKFKK
jgi:hypothetical protein